MLLKWHELSLINGIISQGTNSYNSLTIIVGLMIGQIHQFEANVLHKKS